MMKGRTATLLTAIAMLVLIASPALGLPSGSSPRLSATVQSRAALTAKATEPGSPALYIVQLQDPSLATYRGGVPGLAATSPEATGARKLDASSAASRAYLGYLESQQRQVLDRAEALLGRPLPVTFQYLAVLNGFAVSLTPAEAAAIAKLPEVRNVWRDVERRMETDATWTHLGAQGIWNGQTPGGIASRGEGVVIGVIDSGVNHAHPSFAATDGLGYTHTNPYGPGVYKGWCATNPGFCNDKLIAAYGLNPSGGSPEDTDGHGSHTASTAGGNAHIASFDLDGTHFDLTIAGMAPYANIVAYKVCNPGCPTTASVAAVNSAILNDQVDVLNYSIGGSDSPWNDAVDQAFLDANAAGIFVSASAGNSGPGPSTVAKTGPWNAAVAATMHGRLFANTVDVTGPTTPPELQGMPAVLGEYTVLSADVTGPIRYLSSNNDGCTAFPANFFTGSLALIQRGNCPFADKESNASAAGAIGVVVFNHVGGAPIRMGGLTGTPPAAMLGLADGSALRDYIVANPTATVRIHAAISRAVRDDWYDAIGNFSSRGPSQYEIVKPDYAAPGVNVLAATLADGSNPVQYEFMDGTSMASPHGAGAGALMMSRYPTWTPTEIKSALASTANPALTRQDYVTAATPFDMGSGSLDLAGAANVGLVFNETHANYVAANPNTGGDPKTLNQPSMANYNCAGSCSWTRTAKAVQAGTWTASATAPAGMTLTVVPATFTLTAGATQALTITTDVSGLPLDQFAFGSVTLTPGNPAIATATLPVVVKPTEAAPEIDVTPTSLGATLHPNETTSETLVVRNVGTAPLIWNIDEAPASAPIQLVLDGAAAPDAPNGPISLVLDDGTRENGIGIGGTTQFIFLNRFTPDAGSYPITLNQVQVYFAAQDQVLVGDDMRLAIYENTSGNTNPAVGSNLRATFDVTVGALDAWNIYNLATPLTFNGPGDILIGVIALEIPGSSYWPAAMDQTPPSKERSWAGWWTTATAPGTPTLPPNSNWILIDSAGASFAGNWMVRGYGEGSSACDDPADVPWLTVSPTGATTAPGASRNVSVGFDSTGLALGTYSAVLCVTSNDPGRPLVAVPVSLEVVELVAEPNIDVSPLAMSSTQAPNTTATRTLTIANTGLSTLDWSIEEEDTTAFPPIVAGPPVAQPALENVGAPVEAAPVTAPAPAAIWRAPNAILYDNGPLITNPGAGAGGADVSALQLNNTTLGPNHSVAGDYRVADDFTVPAGGWTIDQITFFAYQTGSGTTSTINAVNLRIWDGPPGQAGSTIIFGDTSTNRMTSTAFSNIYRTSGTQLTNTDRPIMASVVAVGLFLPAGTYWLDWQTGGTLASGPWAPFVTLVGQTGKPGGNARQYTTSWSQLTDSGSGAPQDLPFIIEGTAGAPECLTPSNISWLSLSATTGSNAAGTNTPVTVTFDSAGLATGSYTGNLCIHSNDPNPGPGNGTALVVVPVQLNVAGGPVPDIDVSPPSMNSTQAPNTSTTQTLNVGNTGVADLTWTIVEEPALRPGLANWSDNFDTYATGSQMHGQGGWKGWGNDPAGGALVSDAQSRSTPNSVAVVGTTDLLHEYSETSGQWVFTAWQYVPTTFTGQSYFIMLNRYDDAGSNNNWSVQVRFDGTANQVVNDGGSSGGTLPLVRGRWVQIRVEIDLDTDTGAFYYDNQQLYSGTWSGQVSGGGAQAIGAVDLFANDASVVYYDDMSLVDANQPPVCANPADVPWLSEVPTSGTTAPGGSTPVTVTFDSTGLGVGTYNANLCITSNDPDPGPGNGTDLVVVPVSLTVTGSVMHTVTASVGTPAGTIAPPSQAVAHGATTTFTLTPDSGFEIAGVTGTCPAGTLAGNLYTTGTITADCTVIANFRPESGPGPSVLEIPTLGPAGGALLGLLLAGLGLGTLRRRRV